MGAKNPTQAQPKEEEIKIEEVVSNVPKKPRKIVEDNDIFDFSGMSKVVNNAPLVIDKVQKPQSIQ